MNQNPNIRVSLRDLAEYTKNDPDQEVLAIETFNPVADIPPYPIRIDALTIALCQQGSARIRVDLDEYEIGENTLMVFQPENFIKILGGSDDYAGSMVLCSKEIVSSILPKFTAVLPLMMQHRMMPVCQLTAKEAEGIRSFYTFLKLKLADPPTRFQRDKVLCMLQAALYEIMDIRLSHLSEIPAKHTRKEEIMGRFLVEVCKNFRSERQVGFYAKNLCITPKHLSSVVKEISGRTAGEWVDHYVVMEAKMLLGSTDMTIQEISMALNFANQSFFGKYFKHHTGISPTEFRVQNGPKVMRNEE